MRNWPAAREMTCCASSSVRALVSYGTQQDRHVTYDDENEPASGFDAAWSAAVSTIRSLQTAM
jgi:hypothetical protein